MKTKYSVKLDEQGVKVVVVNYPDKSSRTIRPGEPGYKLALSLAEK